MRGTDRATSYRERGYVVARGAVDPSLVQFLVACAHTLNSGRQLVSDPAFGNTVAKYGDPAFDTLCAGFVGALSEVAATELEPTYSYLRWYRPPCELIRHRDRDACGHTATVHLANWGEPWPFELEDACGAKVRIELDPGDLLLVKGREIPHSRPHREAGDYLQVFLHYVERDGPEAEYRFDRRPALGLSPESKVNPGGRYSGENR